jgi:hypothetical protein
MTKKQQLELGIGCSVLQMTNFGMPESLPSLDSPFANKYQTGSNDVTLQLLKRHAAEFNNYLLNNMTGVKNWFHHFDTRIVAKHGTALCHTFNEEMAKTMSSACKVAGNISLHGMICLLVYFLPCGKTISACCYIQVLQKV